MVDPLEIRRYFSFLGVHFHLHVCVCGCLFGLLCASICMFVRVGVCLENYCAVYSMQVFFCQSVPCFVEEC